MFKRSRIPPRHRSAAYMNLAFGVLPVAKGSVGAPDQAPLPIEILTDEGDKSVGFTTVLEHATDTENVMIEIDLLHEYEVYEIVVSFKTATGFKKVATNQDILLRTVNAAAAVSTRDTQTLTADGAFHDSTLHYVGDGIPVQKVQIYTVMNSADKLTMDLSEIEVFGC